MASRELLITPADPVAVQWRINGKSARTLTGSVRLTEDTLQSFLVAPVSSPAPLLDFFRRGEVARDVRLLAAQACWRRARTSRSRFSSCWSTIATPRFVQPPTHTLDDIPVEALRAYLGRSDVPIGVREFFGDRGIFPAEIPRITADDPLVDSAQTELLADVESAIQRGRFRRQHASAACRRWGSRNG